MLVDVNSPWVRARISIVKEKLREIEVEDEKIGKELHLLYASPKDIVNQFK